MDPQAVLGNFLEVVERLRASTYVTRSDGVRLKYQWERGGPMIETLHEPSEEILKSFLVDFRLLFLQREAIALHRIYNICEQYLQHEQLRVYLRESRRYWAEAHKQSGVRLVVDRNQYNPERIVDLWINGYYFHFDAEKRAELNRLAATGLSVHRAEFHNFLEAAIDQVFYTARVVKAALREGHFRFERGAEA